MTASLLEEPLSPEQLRIARMENNVCPNKCARLVWVDAFECRCPVCGLTHYDSKPFGYMRFAQA